MASPGSRLPAWAPRLDPTLLRTLLGALPWLAVTGLALALLWPVPTGRMPLSADHTVHLTRISMLADELAAGRLRGWSRAWFFGTPVGELYPVLGDLIIIGLRGLSFGSLSWPQAYAVGFSLVFTVQGWAMLRTGRAMGLGPLPGLVAALLVLADVGAYREGGWIYTVFYGVWPQALATALTWLALAELAVACEAQDPTLARRRVATGALAMGAALLAHPMALMSFAIGGPLLVLTLGMRSHAALRRSTAVAGIGGLLGVAVAAWWVVPMLQHRGWMASYGWMWQPLERMAAQVAEGHWTQGMPTAVGVTAGLGLLLLAIFGDRPARLLAGFGVLQWLLASREALWDLRLDQLSEGFAHIQYQRFLITAKPGLFLAAGAAVALPVRAAAKLWSGSRDGGSRGPWARPLAVLLAGASMGLAGWMAVQQRDVCIEREVGKLQLQRVPGDAEFDREYAALLDWMRQQHAADRDQGVPPYRATVVAARNLHWFMDAPALTGMPIYKQGFTPGDNFVHKPEAGTEALLDALRVRYVITTGRRGSRGAREVARFGRIRVLERPDWDTQPVAWLQGPGTLEVLEDHVDGGVVRVRVSGAGEGTRVVFGVAGFPRWSLEHDGVPVEWIEVPVIGDGPSATQAQRRGTELRGGKAHGDDGSEPTLIAADVGDGELTLRYHPRRGTDVLMGVLSVLALVACAALLWRPTRWPAPTRWLDAAVRRLSVLGHPAVVVGLAVLLVIAASLRRSAAEAVEHPRAFGWLEQGHARPDRHVHAGPFKTDMLIVPAVLVDPRRKGPATVEFPGVVLGEQLQGWVAIDDDAAKLRRKGRHHVRVQARGADGSTTSLHDGWLAHRPGRVPLALDTTALSGQTVDLQVVVESEGKAPPPLAFDLQLGAFP